MKTQLVLSISSCLVLIILCSGCVQNYYSNGQAPPVKVTLVQTPSSYDQGCEIVNQVVSGVGQRIDVSNICPVKLVISGVNNEIRVQRGTTVTEIIVSGVDNTIYLPTGISPRIVKSGVDVNIIYY